MSTFALAKKTETSVYNKLYITENAGKVCKSFILLEEKSYPEFSVY